MTRAEPHDLPRRTLRGQPLLFLVTVVVLWSAARVVHYLPGDEMVSAAQAARSYPGELGRAPQQPSRPLRALSASSAIPVFPALPAAQMRPDSGYRSARRQANAQPRADDFDINMAHHMVWAESLTAFARPSGRSISPLSDGPLLIEPKPLVPQAAGAVPTSAVRSRDTRWSIYAWSLVRQNSRLRTLAPGAQYGGSQAGMIVRYALGDKVLAPSLYARAATALASDDDRTLAIGITARPWRTIPVDLAVERRFGLGTGQRDRFAAMVLAGGGGSLGRSKVRVDAFGQAGIVGSADRQGFFNLQMLATRPVTVRNDHSVLVGVGAWAGGQQEIDGLTGKRWVHRVDLGPRAALALPIGGGQMTVALDWRQRVDGNAQPTSGAALTVSAGF